MTEEKTPRLKQIIESSPENKKCADCGMARPQWASTTAGVFICLNCAGVHRSFGVRVSVVKSVGMDSWPVSDIRKMEKGGNARFKAYLQKYGLESLPKSQLYTDKRIKEYAQSLDREVVVEPAEEKKRSADDGKDRTASSRKRKSPPAVDTSSAPSSSFSSSYASVYPSIGGMASVESIQGAITDMLGKAAGYVYTGAGILNEKVIAPTSSIIKEKSTQITDYIKGNEKTEKQKHETKHFSSKKNTDTKFD